MLSLIIKNKYLLFLYLTMVIPALAFILTEGKINSQLSINQLHNTFFDFSFQLITYLGDGTFMVLVGLFLLFLINIRSGFIILSSFLISSILVQLIKRIVFPDFDRPVLFFNKMGIEIYKIPGLDYHSHFSFPSGHSTTAFALFIGFALLSHNNIFKFSCLLIACVIAFSRVYLSQHFMEDIIAGSVLGTITALFMHNIFFRWDKSWMDKRLLNLSSIADTKTNNK